MIEISKILKEKYKDVTDVEISQIERGIKMGRYELTIRLDCERNKVGAVVETVASSLSKSGIRYIGVGVENEEIYPHCHFVLSERIDKMRLKETIKKNNEVSGVNIRQKTVRNKEAFLLYIYKNKNESSLELISNVKEVEVLEEKEAMQVGKDLDLVDRLNKRLLLVFTRTQAFFKTKKMEEIFERFNRELFEQQKIFSKSANLYGNIISELFKRNLVKVFTKHILLQIIYFGEADKEYVGAYYARIIEEVVLGLLGEKYFGDLKKGSSVITDFVSFSYGIMELLSVCSEGLFYVKYTDKRFKVSYSEELRKFLEERNMRYGIAIKLELDLYGKKRCVANSVYESSFSPKVVKGIEVKGLLANDHKVDIGDSFVEVILGLNKVRYKVCQKTVAVILEGWGDLSKKLSSDEAGITKELLDGLGIAKKGYRYDWSMDFRGRLYSGKDYLSPMLSKVCRSFVVFCKSKVCYREDFLEYSYCIYFGKSGYLEAGEKQHKIELLVEKLNAYDYLNADEPFLFIRCCVEWEVAGQSGSLLKFKSNMICYYDLRSSGALILSLLSNNTKYYKSLGLSKSYPVVDYYERRVSDLLKELSEDEKSYILTLLPSQEKRRQFFKRPIMTLNYGLTSYAFKEGSKDLLETAEKHFGSRYSNQDILKYHMSLMNKVYKILKEENIIYGLLQELYEYCSSRGVILTVDDFELNIFYNKKKNTRLRVTTPRGSYRVKWDIKIKERDVRKELSSIIANFIHLVDSYMAREVIMGLKYHVYPIHDSFGILLGDVVALQQSLERVVCSMSEDILLKIIFVNSDFNVGLNSPKLVSLYSELLKIRHRGRKKDLNFIDLVFPRLVTKNDRKV